MGVEPKILVPQNGWWKFHGKPYEQMDDLGCFPPIFGTPIYPNTQWRWCITVNYANVGKCTIHWVSGIPTMAYTNKSGGVFGTILGTEFRFAWARCLEKVLKDPPKWWFFMVTNPMGSQSVTHHLKKIQVHATNLSCVPPPKTRFMKAYEAHLFFWSTPHTTNPPKNYRSHWDFTWPPEIRSQWPL